jgi:hypothetical protein
MSTPLWWNDVRTPIAFLVAPAAVPLIFVAYSTFTGQPDAADAFLFGGSLIVSYGATWAIGVPLYLFLRAQKVTTFVIAPALGFILGAAMMYVLLGRHMSSGNLQFGGLSGAVVGTILWLIARPDRQAHRQSQAMPGN